MPYEVIVSHQPKVVQVRGFGEGTTADTLQLIEEQRATFRACAGYDFLYDAAELRIESGPIDMVQVAQALFVDADTSFARFAIVVPGPRMPLAHIFSALAEQHSTEVHVFRYSEDARRWLGLVS